MYTRPPQVAPCRIGSVTFHQTAQLTISTHCSARLACRISKPEAGLQGEANTAKQAALLQLRIGVTRLSDHCANSTQKTQR